MRSFCIVCATCIRDTHSLPKADYQALVGFWISWNLTVLCCLVVCLCFVLLFAEEGVPSGAGGGAEEWGPTSGKEQARLGRGGHRDGEGEGGDTSGTGVDVEEKNEEEDVDALKNGSRGGETPAVEAEAGCDGDDEGAAEGRRRGDGTGASDADFDDLLSSYLGGGDRTDGGGEGGEGEAEGAQGGSTFGKAGGSLLMPLGALRLLRWVFRDRRAGGCGEVCVGLSGR